MSTIISGRQPLVGDGRTSCPAAPLRTGGSAPKPFLILAALALVVGCASSRPALEPAADPASAGAILADHRAGGKYAGPWAEGVFDALALSGSICPSSPTTPAEVEDLVATALKFAPPDEPGVVAASRALRAIWPCSAEPINSNPAPAIPPPAKAASAA